MAKSRDAGVEEIAVDEEATGTRQGGLARLTRSALRAGLNVALIPITLLPEASQKHMRRASSEFALGVADLLRATSETIDNVADEI